MNKYLEDKCEEDSAGMDEDSCLSACLVDKFVSTAGCLHPRLRPLLANGTSEAVICGHSHLNNLITRNIQAKDDNDLDPGISCFPCWKHFVAFLAFA